MSNTPNPQPSQSFPKDNRLRKRADFVRVQKRGKRLDTPLFLAFVLPAAEDRCRIGMTTSRKVGKAVIRNRIRRLFRESARRLFLPEQWQIDVVWVAKKHCSLDLRQADVDRACLKFLNQLRNSPFFASLRSHPMPSPTSESQRTSHDTVQLHASTQGTDTNLTPARKTELNLTDTRAIDSKDGKDV
ncbi:MAG: ribonuclease P protein component [Myxococcota bacterium]